MKLPATTLAAGAILALCGCKPVEQGPRSAASAAPATRAAPQTSTRATDSAASRPSPRRPSPADPDVRFFGLRQPGRHVVYLVDRSGSMLDTFDVVRHELLRSLQRLKASQTFHVVFFSTGGPLENPPKRLVRAEVDAQRGVAKFLRTVKPEGLTDPLPAIRRAFEVLRNAPRPGGRVVFLVTDGVFADNDKVIAAIAAANKDGAVRVHTVLVKYRSPATEKVLRKIADDNGGLFKFVEMPD